jgi:hypothetical protein
MCRVNVRRIITLANLCNHIIECFKSTFQSVPARAGVSRNYYYYCAFVASSFSWDTYLLQAQEWLVCFLTTSIQSGRWRNRSSIPGIGKAMLFSAATYGYVMGAGASFVSRCPLPSSRMRGSASAISHAFSCICTYFRTGTTTCMLIE